jgi:hypothetical protein
MVFRLFGKALTVRLRAFGTLAADSTKGCF